MRVTSKGQVTIPKPVRDKIGITAGTEVEFRVDGDIVTLRRAKVKARAGKTRGDEIVEALRGSRTRHREMSTEDLMQLLRGDD